MSAHQLLHACHWQLHKQSEYQPCAQTLHKQDPSSRNFGSHTSTHLHARTPAAACLSWLAAAAPAIRESAMNCSNKIKVDKSLAPTPALTCMRKHQLLHACHRWQQLYQRCAWQHKPGIPTSHQPAQRTRLHWGAAAKQRQLLLLLLLLLLGLGNTCWAG
jgi:hypothetical protein